MRKNKIASLLVLIIWLLLNNPVPEVFARLLLIPPLPSSFYGTAKENGENLPVGTIVSAWINGVQCGETQTLVFDGESVYAMDVSGDDPSTPGIIEGGKEGDIVVFQLGTFLADSTGSWHSGTNQELNLSSNSLLEKNYLPLIIN